ncbi:MAG TPA: TIGR01459 family HAD-type hydrolase [Dongiaceae bacterium]|nr:TIGR01459 family HAD-type hydrolase [Dongiaceae bacterium]
MSDRGGSLRVAGVREIAARFRTWFVDAYGVLHDGAAAFPGAVEALTLARQAGVTVVIVTNSAQRVDAVAARLTGAGIAANRYDHIMSSGELTWRHIERLDRLSRLFVLYPSGGPLWLKHLRNAIVDDLAEADLVLAADMPHRTEEAARGGDLPAMLETAAALRLPLLVPDSDVTYPHNGVIRLGPGWIARRYAELGGETIEFGKPYAPIFAAACHLCRAKPEEVIMVGDNLATDIAGANRMGLASLLVLKHGVHGGLSDTALAEAARSHGAPPTYIAPAFIW